MITSDHIPTSFKHYYSVGDVHYCDIYYGVVTIKEGQSIGSYLESIADGFIRREGQYHGKQHE